jgi:hypothetical protein
MPRAGLRAPPMQLRDAIANRGSEDGDGRMTPVIRSARCACGQVQLDCSGEPAKVSVCHCLECGARGQLSASPCSLPAQRSGFQGTRAFNTRDSDNGFPVAHHFCRGCGTTAFWYPSRKPEMVAVAFGCFADPQFPPPDQQVYEHHRHALVFAIGPPSRIPAWCESAPLRQGDRNDTCAPWRSNPALS